jgi:hypothetical protein
MKINFCKFLVLTAALLLLLLLTPAEKSEALGCSGSAEAARFAAVAGISAAEKETLKKYQQMIFVADLIVVVYSVYRYGYNR